MWGFFHAFASEGAALLTILRRPGDCLIPDLPLQPQWYLLRVLSYYISFTKQSSSNHVAAEPWTLDGQSNVRGIVETFKNGYCIEEISLEVPTVEYKSGNEQFEPRELASTAVWHVQARQAQQPALLIGYLDSKLRSYPSLKLRPVQGFT